MKKIIIIVFLLTLLGMHQKNDTTITIPPNALRFRVIANSNTLEDQLEKMQVKKEVENVIYENIGDSKTKEEAKTKIKESIPQIESAIKKYNEEYKINLGLNYFPEKEYRGIKYEQGNYDSLVITLGNGSGENWWCVLFPPLCLLDEQENLTSDVEYRSFIYDTLKKYR